MVQEEMSLKDMSYPELWQPLGWVEWNNLCNFGRSYHEEHLCETMLNLDQWFRRRYRLKIFLIWCSGDPFVQWREPFVQFGRGHYEVQFCEFILNFASGSTGDVV